MIPEDPEGVPVRFAGVERYLNLMVKFLGIQSLTKHTITIIQSRIASPSFNSSMKPHIQITSPSTTIYLKSGEQYQSVPFAWIHSLRHS